MSLPFLRFTEGERYAGAGIKSGHLQKRQMNLDITARRIHIPQQVQALGAYHIGGVLNHFGISHQIQRGMWFEFEVCIVFSQWR